MKINIVKIGDKWAVRIKRWWWFATFHCGIFEWSGKSRVLRFCLFDTEAEAQKLYDIVTAIKDLVITIRSVKQRKTLMFKKTYMFLFLKKDGFHAEPFELKSYNPFFKPSFADIERFTAYVSKEEPKCFLQYTRFK